MADWEQKLRATGEHLVCQLTNNQKVKSTQKSYVGKSKNIMLKYYNYWRISHQYKKSNTQALKVIFWQWVHLIIKSTSSSKLYIYSFYMYVGLYTKC